VFCQAGSEADLKQKKRNGNNGCVLLFLQGLERGREAAGVLGKPGDSEADRDFHQ
jgi:hypothetical protein